MALAQLGLCAASIYAAFLLWGLLQERLTTTPYTAARTLTSPNPQPEYFRASLFLNAIQSLLSALIAVVYLLARRTPGQSVVSALGVDALLSSGAAAARKPGPEKAGPAPPASANGTANGGTVAHAPKGPATAPTKWISPLLLRYAQVAALQSFASQLGFASLRHISYPTLILGKSCKLVPVLLMNVVLYRRRFAAYKYVVVGLVTLGISLFMLFAEEGAGKKKKGAQTSSAWGLALLTANLLLDGATNSTQDEVFARYRVSGGQMMLCMNALATLLMAFTLVVPVPQIPLINPKPADATELSSALAFIARHPEVTRDMLTYCMAGALGQVAIFETLEKFGSLTLVSITVTRKLFTMLLSVFVYSHTLSPLQWIGVATVFAGIGLEAREKRREGLAKKVARDGKAKVKDV